MIRIFCVVPKWTWERGGSQMTSLRLLHWWGKEGDKWVFEVVHFLIRHLFNMELTELWEMEMGVGWSAKEYGIKGPSPPNGGKKDRRRLWTSSSHRTTDGALGFGCLSIPGWYFRISFHGGRAGMCGFEVPMFNFISHRWPVKIGWYFRFYLWPVPLPLFYLFVFSCVFCCWSA